MNPVFPSDYTSILQRIDAIDPVQYGRTRNYTNGAVTYLSPYISRGVISTRQILNRVLDKGYTLPQIEKFVKELCWRDYFQRVAQHKNVNLDIKNKQNPVAHQSIPTSIISASTGIQGIDNAIKQLYETGYMHNHCRMYTASLTCNIARSHWHNPAQWMYYHLLDGDWASNACSWQWVAGANSSKKYYANQENINRYTYTKQLNTYLDASYEALEQMEIPDELSATVKFAPEICLPEISPVEINPSITTFIYNYYNLDPLWHQQEQGNRVLLIEPEFFKQYPVSKQCIDFMLALSKNISGIQVYVGSFQSFQENYLPSAVYYKEHPFNAHYSGIEESRTWISESHSEYYPSFFNYWKKLEKELFKKL